MCDISPPPTTEQDVKTFSPPDQYAGMIQEAMLRPGQAVTHTGQQLLSYT
jgi:hypothetical protein